MKKILTSVDGIGKKKSEKLIKKHGVDGLVQMLETAPEKLKEEFSWIKKKLLAKLDKQWNAFKNK